MGQPGNLSLKVTYYRIRSDLSILTTEYHGRRNVRSVAVVATCLIDSRFWNIWDVEVTIWRSYCSWWRPWFSTRKRNKACIWLGVKHIIRSTVAYSNYVWWWYLSTVIRWHSVAINVRGIVTAAIASATIWRVSAATTAIAIAIAIEYLWRFTAYNLILVTFWLTIWRSNSNNSRSIWTTVRIGSRYHWCKIYEHSIWIKSYLTCCRIKCSSLWWLSSCWTPA